MDASKKTELFQYVLVIKKEKDRSIDYMSILLCLISWIYFLFYATRSEKFQSLIFFSSFLIPAVLAWTEWIRKARVRTGFKTALFVTGLLWLLIPGLRWVVLIYLFFILLDQQSRVPLEVGISDKQIVINTFFRRRYQWNEFSNVVLKDDLLTLDFSNNRILQKEVFPLARQAEEIEFNEFCRLQLQKDHIA